MCLAIRTLLAQLSVYRFDTIKKTGRSRDVLRDFYQDLVPEELRKSLGEFYTPDWLVEHSVVRSCWRAIERRRAADGGMDCERPCADRRSGADLSPLAVQSRQLLIAIADLLQQCKGKDVEIPVLLADACTTFPT